MKATPDLFNLASELEYTSKNCIKYSLEYDGTDVCIIDYCDGESPNVVGVIPLTDTITTKDIINQCLSLIETYENDYLKLNKENGND